MEGSDEYIWRRRIHHGVRYQKSAVPFPESVRVGLEFNVALDRKEPLDLRLLTNAVMLELCDFAKTVTKSETYFFFEILEFNFDLGVDKDDERQCYEYARRAHNKIKMQREQIKLKPRRWKETFPLPDLGSVAASIGAQHPWRYFPKRNKLVDSSVLSDGSRSRRPAEPPSTGRAGAAFLIKKRGGVQVELTADEYPFCKDLGVTLVVRPGDARKDKLNPNLATYGVILELLDFSRMLCGTHTGIVLDLIRHNFGHKMDGALFRQQVCKMMDKKYACLTAKDRDAFRKEPFKVQTQKQGQKRKKRSDPDCQEPEVLRGARKRRATLRLRDEDAEDLHEDGDLSYMCPVEFETDMQSESEAGPEDLKVESLSEAIAVKEEEEEVFVSPQIPDPRSSHARPQHTTLNASDLFSEDQTEDVDVQTQRQKLWARRATRSGQILKSSRVNDLFACCREEGLDFNVASASGRKLHLQLLTNRVLWEVYKFATAMTKSLRSFLFEILDNNFNLLLQDEQHQWNFIFYMITKEKVLQDHPGRRKEEFLQSLFQFPEVYNMVDVTGDFQTGQEVELDQRTDSDPPASSQEPHPFCKKLGLDLWSTAERPASQKLDLTVFTNGAVLEVFAFIRELCGSVPETVNDILEHNFHVDLWSGVTEASQVLHGWYATHKSLMKRQTTAKVNQWLNAVVPLGANPLLGPRPPAADGSEGRLSETEAFSGDVEPEDQKVHSYRACQQIGLDLDVGFKREAKTKLDLQVLTRGVLFEMHRYVERNCNRYVPALYEILDYNFDLSAQTLRKVEFAWAIASQVVAIAGKSGRPGDYLNRPVQLPVEVSEAPRVVCKEEEEEEEPDLDDEDDQVEFVRELKPVDIEVEID